MKSALVDVAVLILFFNRPRQLAQVFEQVKKARPSRLFLYQDGPRGEKDLPGIEACRQVVADIDWECDSSPALPEKELRLRSFGIYFPKMGFLARRQMHCAGRRRCPVSQFLPLLQRNAGPLRERYPHQHDCRIQQRRNYPRCSL